ncbi:hypothetical protein GCM10007108_15580 [Thermogymnomonas acidicola]|uniref:Single-stranded DNA binding protein Ssb-like OB fold domain-containing protein n=1 Tax=Thermogymnomonas acidicola TaxID=399579 RepID=A0AA37FA68_9ARCH|nr:single-stranded DNA-binding protein [Thermogymnomonas acidicola]GGM78319.1 hypothetical protein GCM10007108_15580 [Thermogymnomonas acidicola]
MEGVTKIKDLSPSSRRVNVLGKVLNVGEPKVIQTRFGEEKSVTEVVIADDTGKITLSLWGDQASQASQGQTIYIDNGYITLVKGHMRLNVGKYGSIKEGPEAVDEVNEELDMSEKEYEPQFRNGGHYRSGPRRFEGRRNGSFDRRNYDNEDE